MSEANKHDDKAARAPAANPVMDPENWTTGDGPTTGPQRSHLKTLCQEAGESLDENLTKAQASRLLDELQSRTWRGKPLHAGRRASR